MAYFAKIDENNIVTQVLKTSNEDTNEGYDWLVENLPGTWIKTSYNTFAGKHTSGGVPLRKNFAGVGFSYDSERDAFIAPKPLMNETPLGLPISYHLDEETCQWVATILE
jgi:hypothetical protein